MAVDLKQSVGLRRRLDRARSPGGGAVSLRAAASESSVQTTLSKRSRLFVQLKRHWDDAWSLEPNLAVARFGDVLPPNISQAFLYLTYGRVLPEFVDSGQTRDWQDRSPLRDVGTANLSAVVSKLDRVYVRIVEAQYPTVSEKGGLYQRWVGRIVQDIPTGLGVTNLGQTDELPTGMQTIQALGLESMLHERVIDRAYCVNRALNANGYPIVPATDTIQMTEWAPDFNRTRGRGAGKANACSPELQGSWFGQSRCFCEDPDPLQASGTAAIPWDDNWIAYYLLTFFQPKGNVNDPDSDAYPGEIQFVCADYTPLYGKGRVIEQQGRTVWQILTELAHEEMGLSWRATCPEAYPGAPVAIEFLPRFGQAVSFGSATIQGNPYWTNVAAGDDPAVVQVAVRKNVAGMYRRIRAEGARAVTCFSISPADGTLEKGWSSVMEEAYRVAASGGANYPADDKARKKVNDQYRHDDKFADVFQRFIVPDDWDWQAGDGVGGATTHPVAPYLNQSGEVELVSHDYRWRHDRRVLAWLPLLKGIDYSVFPAILAGMVTGEPIRPFVLVRDDASDPARYTYVDMPFRDFCGGATVTALQAGFGVRVRFSPAHALAKSDWAGAAPSDKDPSFPAVAPAGLDWQTLIATIAMELDQRLKIEVELPTTQAADESTLVIPVPEAQLWYVTPGTVIGIDEDGDLVRTPDPGTPTVGYAVPCVSRNDHASLDAVMAVAQAWHGTQRNAVMIRREGVSTGIEPGMLIARIDPTARNPLEVNTLVTQVWVDNVRDTGSVQILTGDAELDPVKVVGRGLGF